MNAMIIGVQIYIIIGMILALIGTIGIVKGYADSDSVQHEIAEQILTGGNIKLIFLLLGTVVLTWPVLLVILKTNNKDK